MFIFLFGGNKDHILLNKQNASRICLIYLDRQVFPHVITLEIKLWILIFKNT